MEEEPSYHLVVEVVRGFDSSSSRINQDLMGKPELVVLFVRSYWTLLELEAEEQRRNLEPGVS